MGGAVSAISRSVVKSGPSSNQDASNTRTVSASNGSNNIAQSSQTGPGSPIALNTSFSPRLQAGPDSADRRSSNSDHNSRTSSRSNLFNSPLRPSALGRSQSSPAGTSSVPSRDSESAGLLYRRTLSQVPSSDGEGESNPAAEVFMQTAMSLGLDNEDLLFNMMYFDEGTAGNFGSLVNTIQQETLALYSANNTPYKLNPADDKAISGLIHESFVRSEQNEETECQVCKDEIEENSDITRIPHCKHYFHAECLIRWVKLQAWCPVCRSSLENHINLRHDEEHKDELCEESHDDEEIEVMQGLARKLDFGFPSKYDDTADDKHTEVCTIDSRQNTLDRKDSELEFEDSRDVGKWSMGENSLENSVAKESAEKIISTAFQRAMGREFNSAKT